MPLPMTRPWKHPKTGIYWLRKRVPAHLQEVVGKVEEKLSLKTREPGEAKKRHAVALAALEQRWDNLAAGPRRLTEREAHDLARPLAVEWLALYEANPSQQDFWPIDLGGVLWTDPPLDLSLSTADLLRTCPEGYKRTQLRDWCFRQADQLLTANGLRVAAEEDRKVLAVAVSAAMQRASVQLERLSRGELIEPQATTAPPAQRPAASPLVRFDDLLKGWVAETRPAKKTQYEWTRVVGQLEKFLGHDNAARVTAEDIVRWKAELVAQELSPKTIRDAKLAPVRAVLQWGADNKRLSQNPAAGVSIDVRQRALEMKRGFSETEVAVVLPAARLEVSPVLRWLPWLSAFTGARIAELSQLRREDVVMIEDVWCVRITPEAGPLKTLSSERIIPLHSALLAEGFLDFARTVPSGPLFTQIRPDKFGSRGGNATKVLGRWVRSLGIVDERISPNHSWRHRFKTLARRHGLATDVVDAMVGHQRRTVADSYGEFPASALQRELEKIPPLKF